MLDYSCFLFKGLHTDTLHVLLYKSSELREWESHTHTPLGALVQIVECDTRRDKNEAVYASSLQHRKKSFTKNSFAVKQSRMKDMRGAACDSSYSGEKNLISVIWRF